jgi:acetyl esterase/lipase
MTHAKGRNTSMPNPIRTIPSKYLAHIKRKMLDIPYASLSPAQKLDIYLPEKGRGPFPVIVSIHGGAFMFGEKGDAQVLPMLAGLNRGYAVVSINYRMSGEAKFPALVHDMKAALRWIRARAGRWDLDPGKIAVWGGSAGGYQAAMAGVSYGVPELEDLSLGNPGESSRVQAVVDWFGPTDFLKMDEQLIAGGFTPNPEDAHNGEHSPESLLMGKQITLIPERVNAANPETYISAGAPPFLIQHGTKDDTVPCLQSVYFAEKLTAVLGPERVTLDLFEGAGHGDAQFGSPENLNRVFAFLDKNLK